MTRNELMDYRGQFFDKRKIIPNIVSLTMEIMTRMIDEWESFKNYKPHEMIGEKICGLEIIKGQKFALIYQNPEQINCADLVGLRQCSLKEVHCLRQHHCDRHYLT